MAEVVVAGAMADVVVADSMAGVVVADSMAGVVVADWVTGTGSLDLAVPEHAAKPTALASTTATRPTAARLNGFNATSRVLL
jgi:hypothetical protein